MVVSLTAIPSWAEQEPDPAPAQTSSPPTSKNGEQPVVDETVEAAKKKARETGKRVEIPERNTENMTLFANPDGKTLRIELSSEPVRVKKADGKSFAPIDTTLVEAGGVIKPKAAKGNLVLSAGRDKTLLKSQAADATAKITTPSALPEPKLKGNTATYRSAYGKGRDLVVTATRTGFQQQITIAERPTGPVSFPVPVDLPKGMSFTKNAAGWPTIVGEDGKTLTEVRPTLLQDAKAADLDAPLDAGKLGKAAVTLAEDGKTLVFTPDAAFLADAATTYPVTMTAAASDWYEGHTGDGVDAYINDVDLTDSWDTFYRSEIVVGKSYASSTAKRWRGYLKFPDIPAELAGSKVENADLNLWNHQSNDCGEYVGSGITARRITSDWDEMKLYWNSQPSVTSAGADTEYGAYSEDCNYAWNLVHSINGIVQAWIDGATNYGIQLTAGNESELRNWRRYASEEAGGCRTKPLEDCKFQLHPPILTVDVELPTPPPPPRRETVVISTPELLGTFPEYEEAVRKSMYMPESADEIASVGLSPEMAAKVEMQQDGQPYFVGADKLDAPEEPWEEDETTDPDGEDTIAPRVVAYEPAAGATDVPLDAKVRVTFSEPIGDAVISVKTSQGTAITGTLARDDTQKIVTFTPQQPLSPGTTYTVEVSEAIDSWENTMAPYTWSFTTLAKAAGHWTFDEGEGDAAADSSGNNHDASLNDTAKWVAGKSGNAVSNAPSQARIAVSHSAAKQGKAIEITDETTATSITYAQPDGKTYKTEVTAGPVRTRQGSEWVPIDTTLVEQNGMLKPKAIASDVAVAIANGGAGAFVSMAAINGQSYALSWPTALPKPTISKNTATFTDAAGKGADLVVAVLPTGFRHEVVLRERPAKPLKIRIGVQTSGLNLSEGKSGRLLLKGKNKKLVAAGTRPTMSDGSTKGRRSLAKHAEADTDVVTKNGRTELVVTPDQAFLTDADTTYPVRVASVVTLPLSADVDVSTNDTIDWPAYPDNQHMMAGTMRGGFKGRVHLRFDTTDLPGSTVTAATLSMNTIDSHNCGAALANGIQVARLTSAWDPDNQYWAGNPGHTTEDASTNFKGVNVDCATYPDSMEWNVTDIAQDWAAGAANHGLVLKSPGEANINNYRVFTSSEDTEFNLPPKLTITTSGPASAPSVSAPAITPAQAVGGTTVTTSLTPHLAATVADSASGNLTGEFEIEHDPAATGQGSGQIWAGASQAVTSGTQATVNVPAGKLTDGWKIRWRARVANATAATTSAWSDWQTATVDVPNPTVGAMQVTPSQVVDGGTVTTSLAPALRATVTDPGAQPLRAEFEVEHDPAATGQGTGQLWTGSLDNVASGTQASATVPDGKLADGWKVRWRIRAINTATTVGSPWSDWQTLTVDVPDPISEPAVAALQVTPSEQVDGTTVTSTLTPVLLAQVNDPAGKPLRAEAEIEHDPAAPTGQGSGQIWTGSADNVPASTQASITVPTDTLTDGWKVRWRARAVSATAASAWSDWQSFTVSLPKPTTAGLTITPSKVVDGATVSTTLTPTLKATVTHPTGQALRAEAEIEHDPTAPEGQGTGQIWTGNVDNVASGTQASVTMPDGKLADGWKVRWRLRAVTEQAASAWSDWQQVTVDVTQPGEEPLAQTSGPVIRTDQSFTAAAWLRWSDKDGDYTVLEQRGTHTAPFRLGNTADHGLVFTFTSADAVDATIEGVLSDVEPPVNEWFHLAGVYDATAKSASLYLNGTLTKTAPISFTVWNADAAMALGSRMKGDLDEVEIYQRSFDAAEITAFLASPVAQVTHRVMSSAPPPANPYKFDYEHIDLQDCKDTAGFDYKYYQARIQEKPYLACWSAYLYMQDFEEDPISRTLRLSSTKSAIMAELKKEFGVDFFEDDDRFRFRATWVIHSYLGNGKGDNIHPTPLPDWRPQDIKIFTRLDEIAVEDGSGRVKLSSAQIKGLDMGIEVMVESKEDGTDCKVRSGSHQRKDVSAWHTDPDDQFIIRASAADPENATPYCTIKPIVTIWDDQQPDRFYLWSQAVKDELGLERGVRRKGDTTNGQEEVYAPYFRCDFKTFHSTAGKRTGGCINAQASRIFEMSLSRDKQFAEVTQHIKDAMDPEINKYTFPPLRDGHDWSKPEYPPAKIDIGGDRNKKNIPGNWLVKGSKPLLRAPDGVAELNRKQWSDIEMFMDVGTRMQKHWKQDKGTNYCKYYFSEKYPEQTHPDYPAGAPWLNCDEFPFASTRQGAAAITKEGKVAANGHYSLRAVNATHNRLQGNTLGSFYAHYRVGSNNPFWVAIVD
ncbi:DNRLRE domain-containing protein [Planomonospora corallina]|uniref:DNRLRE domain-containing protein n=1 Tax=Planomonospora corallina TaxID=1806052 RepID=A0ABV8IA05_9ACTN